MSQPKDGSTAQPKRAFHRYPLLPIFQVEARWNGRLLPLKPVPRQENIGGGGLCFGVSDSARPPVGAELEISIPLVEGPFHPARVRARCRARVLRHEPAERVAVQFQEISFVREERDSRLSVLELTGRNPGRGALTGPKIPTIP